uniref:ArgoN domain-containing protein n=1 Tax=Bursaphelenchus xylophilus TaxID=6326 RepID=A0A1I7SH54_BURXY
MDVDSGEAKRRREDELNVSSLNISLNEAPKKLPPQSIPSGCNTSIRLNGYNISLAKKNEPGYLEKIYKYRVTIAAQYPDRITKDEAGNEFSVPRKERLLHDGMNGDVAKSQRSNISYVVLENVAQQFYGFKGMEYVYDRVNIVYSSKKLCEESRIDVIEVAGNEKLVRLDTSFYGRPSAYKVDLSLVEIVNPHNQEEIGALVQFLEIATSVKAYRNIAEALAKREKPKVEVTKNKIYFPLESKPFNNDPRILMKGIDKSVTVAGDLFNPKFILKFDAKSSPFFPEGELVTFLSRLMTAGRQFGGPGGGFRDRSSSRASYRDSSRDSRAGYDRGGYEQSGGGGGSEELAGILRDNRKLDLATLHLKNVVVRTTHLGEKNKVFPIHGLRTNSIIRQTRLEINMSRDHDLWNSSRGEAIGTAPGNSVETSDSTRINEDAVIDSSAPSRPGLTSRAISSDFI